MWKDDLEFNKSNSYASFVVMFHVSLCYTTLSVSRGLAVGCWKGLASWLS